MIQSEAMHNAPVAETPTWHSYPAACRQCKLLFLAAAHVLGPPMQYEKCTPKTQCVQQGAVRC